MARRILRWSISVLNASGDLRPENAVLLSIDTGGYHSDGEDGMPGFRIVFIPIFKENNISLDFSVDFTMAKVKIISSAIPTNN